MAQDDEQQASLASTFIKQTLSEINPGFITAITLVETTWVLQKCYHASKEELCSTIKAILETKQFQVEQAELCYKALRMFRAGNGDFSDALIATIAKNNGCAQVVTFDKKAQNVGMTLLTK